MIAFVIKEITFLKILTPVIMELHKSNQPYTLYHYIGSSAKPYSTPTISKIKSSSNYIIENARSIVGFKNDSELLNQILRDKIKKFVSIETWLCFSNILKSLKNNNIKTYSIQYLTDSIWQKKESVISLDRVYYTSKYIMDMNHKFAGITFDKNRDRCLGSPLLDFIKPNNGDGDILILTPNIRAEHVNQVFGKSKNIFNILEKISEAGNLIFKTRKKQWFPQEFKSLAKEIIDDGDKMYPPSIDEALARCHTTILFYSSGIFEAVSANNYVINIPIPLKFWRWEESKKQQYFNKSPGLYRFPGVVESVDQGTILSSDWKFKFTKVNEQSRLDWIKNFSDNTPNSAKLIAEDISK